MADHTLIKRLHSRLAKTELKAVLAEEPRLVILVENSLHRARKLVEQRRVFEAQVWLAGITAVVEGRLRKHLVAKQGQEKRVATLVAALGSDPSAKGLGDLLSHAATLRPDVTSELLDIVENALAFNE